MPDARWILDESTKPAQNIIARSEARVARRRGPTGAARTRSRAAWRSTRRAKRCSARRSSTPTTTRSTRCPRAAGAGPREPVLRGICALPLAHRSALAAPVGGCQRGRPRSVRRRTADGRAGRRERAMAVVVGARGRARGRAGAASVGGGAGTALRLQLRRELPLRAACDQDVQRRAQPALLR